MLDNYATHKTPAIRDWLVKHPRFHLHFTPASWSWLNLAGRWFAELASRKLRRSAHRSVTELEADIRKWINERNKDPRPFVRAKSADEILEAIAEYCQRGYRAGTLGRAIVDDGLRQRWDTPEGVLLAGEVLGRLRAGQPLGGLGLGEVAGRVDLRGFPAPQPGPLAREAARRDLAAIRAGSLAPGQGRGRLELVEVVGVTLRGLDLSGAVLDKVTIRDCLVEDCLLDGVHGHGLGIARSRVRDTSFRDADLGSGGLGRWQAGTGPEFDRVNFSGADLRKWGQVTAWFRDCDFSGARLDECRFTRCGLVRCRFSGPLEEVMFRGGGPADAEGGPDCCDDVDMSGAVFRGVAFRGFDVDAVRLPDDPALQVIRQWPRVVRTAIAMLEGREDKYGYFLRMWLEDRLRGIDLGQPVTVLNKNDFVAYDEGKQELAALAESVIHQAERACRP